MTRVLSGSNSLRYSAAWSYAFSVFCRFRTADLTNRQTLVAMTWVATANPHGWFLEVGGDISGDPVTARTINAFGGDASAQSSSGIQSDVWHSALGYWASASSRGVYLDGANKGTSTTNVNPAAIDYTAIGATVSNGGNTVQRYFTGDICDVAIWSAQLNDTEALLLARGVSPLKIRPASLSAYLPLVATNADVRTSRSFSNAGTVTWGSGPAGFSLAAPKIGVPDSSYWRQARVAAG